MITNKQVYDALTSGITKRWNLHAEYPDGLSPQAENCNKLCRLFERVGCDGCPILIETGVKCGRNRKGVEMRKYPWYLRDKYGWPIEFIAGRGRAYRWLRIAVQNLRKVIG